LRAERDSRDYLRDIARYAEVGERMLEGLDFDEFAKDEVKILAALQVLEIIGEASKKVPDSLKRRYPEIPWKDVAGTRDKLIHGYFDVDLEVVWRSLREDLPPLRRTVARMLEDLQTPSE
jgi:uncharacterized protein with HEPN domain